MTMPAAHPKTTQSNGRHSKRTSVHAITNTQNTVAINSNRNRSYVHVKTRARGNNGQYFLLKNREMAMTRYSSANGGALAMFIRKRNGTEQASNATSQTST